jgi:hypothetical protein
MSSAIFARLVLAVSHPHIRSIPLSSSGPTKPLAAITGFPEPERLAMNPRFLRDEAARFRDMAETQDRIASKHRYLAMAADYESQAEAADELTKASDAEVTIPKAVKKIAKKNANEEAV